LDIVIVPGIAFDPNGGRVGRGKGYYDRFIKNLPEKTITIGLAFDFQLFDEVPMNENDQLVKTIISETQTYTPIYAPRAHYFPYDTYKKLN
jgi:5-formyltetrahydrofolate cyclo-ligase